MRALRIACVFLLIYTPLVMVVSAERSWREIRPETGLTLDEHDGAVYIARVASESPAERAGLAVGQRVVTIHGREAKTLLVARDLLLEVRPGRPVGITIDAAGTTVSTRVRTQAVVTWHGDRMVAAAVALLFYLGALAAWYRRKHDGLSLIYALWCLAAALMLGCSWSPAARSLDWVLYWSDRIGRLLLPALGLHWMTLLVGRASRGAKLAPLFYAPAAALLVAEIQIVGRGSALRAADPVALVDLLQSRFELGWLAAGTLLALATLLLAWRRAVERSARARLRWLMTGALVGVAPYLLLSAAPQILRGTEPAVSLYALPFLALLPLVFTGAVLQYRLMDLTLFARRTVSVVVTSLLAIVLWFGLRHLIEAIFGPLLDPDSVAPLLIAAAVVAGLIPTLKAVTRELVGRLYYRRRYSFRRALEHVARDLNAERELPRLVERLELRVREALDAGNAQLLFVEAGGTLRGARSGEIADRLAGTLVDRLARGESLQLADIPAAPQLAPQLHLSGVQWVVPLRVEDRLIGVLTASPRPGGRLLDSDDRDLLRSVAAHAAAAVAGACHLAELREQMVLVQQLRERTEAVIESSPIGMAVIDTCGIVRHWNPALEGLLRVTRVEAQGRGYREVLPAVVAAQVAAALQEVTAPSSRAFRVRIGERGSHERLVNLTTSLLHGSGGDPGILLTIDDVTEQVRLEERLIQQDRLASVGMLAAGVAHEVNTPLTGISSFAQMLLEETPRHDGRRSMLEKIVQQAGRASRIARDLLRLSRPTGQQSEPGLASVDLRDMVEDSLGLLAPQIRHAGVTVDRDWNGAPIVAWGDRSRLQQVVMNLLINALDAVKPGGRVVVRLAPEQGDQVSIDVEDDGVGIPEGVRDRIFDPFFTTKKAGSGTGLGLSVSYAIVREHGGQLLVDSEPGRGTTMRVLLPAVARDRHAIESVDSRAS